MGFGGGEGGARKWGFGGGGGGGRERLTTCACGGPCHHHRGRWCASSRWAAGHHRLPGWFAAESPSPPCSRVRTPSHGRATAPAAQRHRSACNIFRLQSALWPTLHATVINKVCLCQCCCDCQQLLVQLRLEHACCKVYMLVHAVWLCTPPN